MSLSMFVMTTTTSQYFRLGRPGSQLLPPGRELERAVDRAMCTDRLQSLLSVPFRAAGRDGHVAVRLLGSRSSSFSCERAVPPGRGASHCGSHDLIVPVVVRSSSGLASIWVRSNSTVSPKFSDPEDFGVQTLMKPRLDAAEFLDAYTNVDADVMWITGHGEYDHADPRRTHLPMADGSRVSAEDLAIPATAQVGRRLPALNVCDSGTVLLAGGLPEFGLGAIAVGSSQAVIGHAWPVVAWPDAAMLGRLLAGALVTSESFFAAYERAWSRRWRQAPMLAARRGRWNRRRPRCSATSCVSKTTPNAFTISLHGALLCSLSELTASRTPSTRSMRRVRPRKTGPWSIRLSRDPAMRRHLETVALLQMRMRDLPKAKDGYGHRVVLDNKRAGLTWSRPSKHYAADMAQFEDAATGWEIFRNLTWVGQ